jgi:hypothetical protein
MLGFFLTKHDFFYILALNLCHRSTGKSEKNQQPRHKVKLDPQTIEEISPQRRRRRAKGERHFPFLSLLSFFAFGSFN